MHIKINARIYRCRSGKDTRGFVRLRTCRAIFRGGRRSAASRRTTRPTELLRQRCNAMHTAGIAMPRPRPCPSRLARVSRGPYDVRTRLRGNSHAAVAVACYLRKFPGLRKFTSEFSYIYLQ